MADKKGDKPKQGKVLPPEKEKTTGDTKIIQAVIANIHERPDLMMAELEKLDPGFTKRTNKRMEANAERLYDARFKLGQIQAYTGLAVKVLAALFCFYLLYLAVTGGGFAFFSIIAITIFYGISQSGAKGFSELATALAQWITKGIKGNNRDD